MNLGYNTVSVRHHFSAGHRLVGLDGPGAKCSNLHGHTFAVQWTFLAPDRTARSIEFGALKAGLRGWVDDNLDHGYICHTEDEELFAAIVALRSKHFITEEPPTTETIAWVIAKATSELFPDLDLISVTLDEGPSNSASWVNNQWEPRH